jgi:UTP--glucose-1-phosphate uridylyltransferase
MDRIVVIDDRRLVAEALASALRVRGHRVLGAGTSVGRVAELRPEGPNVVVVMEVDPDEVGRYGVIDPNPQGFGDDKRLHRVRGLVEKPDPANAPSNLAIIGRYVLTPKIFEKLEQTPRGAGGEIQLTDAIEALIADQDVFAYAFEGRRYDAGTTMGWLKASVELALERADIGAEFRRYLAGLDLS